MSDPWTELDKELDAWDAAGLEATFWLRDDDAIADTASLRRLLQIGRDTGTPVCLAVIPRDADGELARAVADFEDVMVMQHGWCHANHAGPDEKKFELGDHRPQKVIAEELARGDARLRDLFGARYAKVLAPPWNRIGTSTAAGLAGLGYRGLSVFGPRHKSVAADGMVRVNTHVDIIDWKGSRGFLGVERVIAQALAHLEARRTGAADASEPTGLITHHLVHDDECWAFIGTFAARTHKHRGVRWLGLTEVFS